MSVFGGQGVGLRRSCCRSTAAYAIKTAFKLEQGIALHHGNKKKADSQKDKDRVGDIRPSLVQYCPDDRKIVHGDQDRGDRS